MNNTTSIQSNFFVEKQVQSFTGSLEGRCVVNSTENIRSLIKYTLESKRREESWQRIGLEIGSFLLTAVLVSAIFLSVLVSPAFIVFAVAAGFLLGGVLLCTAGPHFVTAPLGKKEEEIQHLADRHFIAFAEEYEISLNIHTLGDAIALYKDFKAMSLEKRESEPSYEKEETEQPSQDGKVQWGKIRFLSHQSAEEKFKENLDRFKKGLLLRNNW